MKVRIRRLLPLLLLPALFSIPELRAGDTGSEQMHFGVQAAKKGLWREALFRWERAHKLLPDNARILNNLAVAYETNGDFDRADVMYREALRLAPDNRDIRQNYDLFNAYYKDLAARKPRPESPQTAPAAPEPVGQPEEKPPDAPPR